MSKQNQQSQPAAPQFSPQEQDVLRQVGVDVSDPQNINWGSLLPKIKDFLLVAVSIIDKVSPFIGGFAPQGQPKP